MTIPSAYLGTGKKYHSVNISAAGAISLPVRLSRPAAEQVQVGIALSGSRAIYGDTPEYGSAWVGGAGHTLSTATLTFAAGEILKTATINLIERKTTDDKHIPFVPEVLKATLSIPEASVGKVRAGSVGTVVDIRVADDLIQGVFNVKDYGAKGDGITNDQAAIEAAIAAAAASISNQTTQQAIVYFPRGIYRVYMSLSFSAGITLVGQDRATTIIKRLDRSVFVANNFEDEWTLGVVVSGISVVPATGTVYQDSLGNKWKTKYTTNISGGAGVWYLSHIPDGSLPPESGILTKVGSGTGDTSINYSAVAPLCVRFTVSGVSVTPAIGATYTYNSNTYEVVYAAISGGSGAVICRVTNGHTRPSDTGTLTKLSGTGDAAISYSATYTQSPSSIAVAVSGVTVDVQAGAVYSTNGWSATVQSVNITNGSGYLNLKTDSNWRFGPNRSGTLTKDSGTGQSSISFSGWIGYGRWWARMMSAGAAFSNANPSSISGLRNVTIDGNIESFPECITLGASFKID